MVSNVEASDSDQNVTLELSQAVPTGCIDDSGNAVWATLTFTNGVPSVANLFYLDDTGALITVSQGQQFQKPANDALKPQISWSCLYLNDVTNETSREVMQRTAVACDTDGNIVSTTVDLFEMDRVTAVAAAGTEVLSKEEACYAVGEETVAIGSALTVPANAAGATIQVDPDGSAVRYTFDGSTPDDDSFAASPGSWITVCKPADLAGFTALAADESGAVDAAESGSLRIHYVSTELH